MSCRGLTWGITTRGCSAATRCAAFGHSLSHDVASADAHRNTESEPDRRDALSRPVLKASIFGNGRGKGLQSVNVNSMKRRCQNARSPKIAPRNQISRCRPKARLVHNNAAVTIRDTTAANISSAAFPSTSFRPILEPISDAIIVNCRCLSCRGGHGSSSLHDVDARSCKHNNVCWSPELRGACRLGHQIDPRVDTQRRYGARAHAGSRLSISNCIGYCLLS